MGQKVHPKGFRLGVIKTWGSRWYADKSFAKLIHEDIKIKKYVKKTLEHAGIADVGIERAASKVRVNIDAARPGIIIGKKGTEITKLKNQIQKMTDKEIFINISEVKTRDKCSAGCAKCMYAAVEKGRIQKSNEKKCKYSFKVWCGRY